MTLMSVSEAGDYSGRREQHRLNHRWLICGCPNIALNEIEILRRDNSRTPADPAAVAEVQNLVDEHVKNLNARRRDRIHGKGKWRGGSPV